MLTTFLYKNILRPVLFKTNADKIHPLMVGLGENLGRFNLPKPAKLPIIQQTVAKINFQTPIGLSAGFDYEGRLTQILPFLDFGFETIGTITNKPFEGNPRPLLGRLPKSQSLMVNKGFKNLGTDATIKKLAKLKFKIPIGLSIGSREANVHDIVAAFKKFESSKLEHSYYELNISCPNLQTAKNFYSPKNLETLLNSIDRLKLTRPVFVKMPISKTDDEILAMIEVIIKHCPKGVIIGNLQTNRQTLHPEEINKYSVGNFSGKPTFDRSNELISLIYKKYGQKIIIIGCGGVFSAADAWEKITRGATLVQLITGLIFEGPQLIFEINRGLVKLLHQNSFQNLSEAVGSKVI